MNELLDFFEENGYVLLPKVLSKDEVQSLRNTIDGLYPFGLDYCKKTDHYKCVFNRDVKFLNLLDKEPLIDIAENLMGEDCHIIGQSAWRSHPGHDGWFPHTDRTFVEFPEEVYNHPEFKLPVFLCTAHFYLDDMTLDLAPTYVIPGSHKSGKKLNGEHVDPVYKGKKLQPVLCDAGDVLLFRSEIWHTGSKNTSNKDRYLIQTHYSRREIAQQFSPYMKFQFSPHIIEVANPRQRRLLGEHSPSAYD